MKKSKAKGSVMLPFVVFPLLTGAALLVSGCADLTGEALHQDLAHVRQDINALTLAVHRNRGEAETVLGQLDRRSREQAGESARHVSGLSTRLDSITAELSRLAARLDEISQRVDSLRLAERAAPRVAPLAAPSPGPAAPGALAVGPGPRPPAAATPPPGAAAVAGGPAPRAQAPTSPGPRWSTGSDPSPEESYQAAYLDFTKGNYPLAVSGFREFVRRYPDSPLADNAQYWIGESYFSLGRGRSNQGQPEKANEALEQAVQEFRKVFVNYPRGNRVPTAIYKEALALLELKQAKVAQVRLQYLLDNFPQSEEAPLAKERLAAIKE